MVHIAAIVKVFCRLGVTEYASTCFGLKTVALLTVLIAYPVLQATTHPSICNYFLEKQNSLNVEGQTNRKAVMNHLLTSDLVLF